MDFILMLSRQDRTVPDCPDILAQTAPLGLKHIGFKDIGADEPTLRALNAGIPALGAERSLEIVATAPEAALRAAGADAFTIGSAAFDGSFAPAQPGLIAQLKEINA